MAFVDNQRLVSGTDTVGLAAEKLRMWKVEDGSVIGTFEGTAGGVSSIDLFPDGRRMITTSVEGGITVWDLETRREATRLREANAVSDQHSEAITAVAVSPDGTKLATGSVDWSVKLWDWQQGKVLRTMKPALLGLFGDGHADVVLSVAFSPDGTLLASGSNDKTVKLWEVASGKCLRTLRGHRLGAQGLAFASTDELISGGSSFAGNVRSVPGEVRFWDVRQGKPKDALTESLLWVTTARVSADGKTLVTAHWNGQLKVWDLPTRQPKFELLGHTRTVNDAAISPDGKTLATVSYDRTVRLWHLPTGQELMTLPDHNGVAYAVAFSPSGRTLVTCGQRGETLRGEILIRRTEVPPPQAAAAESGPAPGR